MKIKIKTGETRTIVPFDGTSPDLSNIPASTRALVQAAFNAGDYEVMPAVEIIPTPDWTGFNLAIVADPSWQSWDIPTDLRNALICTAVVELESKFRTAYQTAKAIVPPSTEAVAFWQQVAAEFHIPLIF
jgi:hypothetical protein